MNLEIFEKTLWSYKDIDDNDLSNKCNEIILSFLEKQKFELNLNRFFSKFNIDLDSFLDEEKSRNLAITDDVYSSDYHHSLIIGNYDIQQENTISLTVQKIFTNQEKIFTEENNTINLPYDKENQTLKVKSNSIIGQIFKCSEDIELHLLKK